MKYLYGIAVLACVILWSSCRNDFETVASTGNLEFSRDTVYLDTVFTNIGSSTYNLKVYNRSDDDINIPTITLGDGEASSYRLNVDGIPGKSFENITILAKDSIFVFIETTIDINNFPNPDNAFLYTDEILFDTGGNQQDVDLVTLVQDAVFLFPERSADGTVETLNLGVDDEGNDILVEGFFLDDTELNFTNEKPYVIYGFAAVPSDKTLTIDAGARVHFHADSGIIVANMGSIQANGAPSTDPELMENEVIFEGDRLEPSFANVPGQWSTIWLTQGSINNVFTNTTIKNSIVGILNDNSPVSLTNVQIYNSANVGLLGRTATVVGNNLVINNSGQASLACSLGGDYIFNHSTFANYWVNNFRTFPAVLIDNVLQVSETEVVVADLVRAEFNNCIVYGNEQREIGFVNEPSALFNFKFNNCLIRFEDPNGEFTDIPEYQFQNNDLYSNIVRNQDPVFFDVELNDFNIETGTSGADGIGLPGVGPVLDLNGTQRGANPDAGAYESIVFPDPGGTP
ncbi:MAG: hypothetical protein KJO05_05965 [Bacteroidia bacterium]|nr:hypothetical protein [Bacteroidia bacterium]NNF30589.1 hypothetical protein [Flavobacteriaceae bacterium]MBT8275308.1 hypothetical protein [Bacteroidia bacterium]NNJ81606.1 hypothetical protein [Flavobacteriaceae bacterium]NNK53066.1 hypothetical protein [Flavobacteriaceae bacterium]